MKIIKTLLAACLAAVCVSTPASAADNSGWRFNITPYIWLPSVDSELSVKDTPLTIESDGEQFDIFNSNIDFAFLIAGQVRKDRLGFIWDAEYISFNIDSDQVGGGDVDAEVTFFTATALASYAVVQEEQFTLDLAGGARVLYADTEITLEGPNGGADITTGEGKTWVDPIIALKSTYQFNESWGIHAYADIGGFGVSSELTYQILATVSYSFNENIALQVGYRYFAVDFEDGPFKFDADLYGPLVGLTFRF